MSYPLGLSLIAVVATFFALREVWLAWWPASMSTDLACEHAANNVDVFGAADG